MKTREQLEAKAWEIALDFHLSEYPRHIPPLEILEMIEQEHEDILVCQEWEYSSPYTVIENIEIFQKNILVDLEWVQQ